MNEFQKYQYGIIYKALNLINNKPYVGQTIRSLYNRKRHHISDAKVQKYNNKFCVALRNYKDEEWKWEILYILNEFDDIDELEIKYVRENNSFFNGYNSTFGGNPYRMKYLTKEEKTEFNKRKNLIDAKYYYKIFKEGILVFRGSILKEFCEENNINPDSIRICIRERGYYGEYIGVRIKIKNWNLMSIEDQEKWIKIIPDSVINQINDKVANHDKYNYKIFKEGVKIDETTNLKKYCNNKGLNYRLFDNDIRRKGKHKEYTIERTLII